MDALAEQVRLRGDSIGPGNALLMIAAVTVAACIWMYASINRRIVDSKTEAQDVVTEQFVKVQSDNSALQKRLNDLHHDMAKLREESAVGAAERTRMAEQLDEAHVNAQKATDDLKASNEAVKRLQAELSALRTTLMALEQEKAAEGQALEREKLHTLRLQQQNEQMQVEINQLKERLARLEGENNGLLQVLTTLKVVTGETRKGDAEESAA